MATINKKAKRVISATKKRSLRSGAPTPVASTLAKSLRVELRNPGHNPAEKAYIKQAVALAKEYGAKGSGQYVRRTLRHAAGLPTSTPMHDVHITEPTPGSNTTSGMTQRKTRKAY